MPSVPGVSMNRFSPPTKPKRITRGPTAVVTISSTSPLLSLAQSFHPP